MKYQYALLTLVAIGGMAYQSCNANSADAISYTATNYLGGLKSITKNGDDFEYRPNTNDAIIVSDDSVVDDTVFITSDDPILAPTEVNDSDAFVNIVAVGDIMIGSSFPSVDFLPPDDGKNSFAAVKPYLVGDVVFGNLEGVLLDGGVSTKCPPMPTDPTGDAKPKTCYAFRMPTRYGKIIKDAGFNLLSIANNHVGDFGDAGRISTKNTLSDLGIYSAGLLSKPTTTFTKNGVKYGMVAFAPNIGTVSINELETAKAYVQALDKKVDIVIVSFHGGAEGSNHTRVPKTTEMYLNENRGDVYKFSHSMIDAGADIVLGHGPHVTRAVEVYNDRFIAYSLGNFNTYGAFNLRGTNGIAPLLNVKLTKDGKFVLADVVSIYQTKENGLMVDKQNRAFGELKRLTQLDFPNSGLIFKNNQITR